jgi:hypothetical protein
MLPETADFIFSSTIDDEISGESTRTTKTSVFVSETPYLRKASVIWVTLKKEALRDIDTRLTLCVGFKLYKISECTVFVRSPFRDSAMIA